MHWCLQSGLWHVVSNRWCVYVCLVGGSVGKSACQYAIQTQVHLAVGAVALWHYGCMNGALEENKKNKK